MLKEFRAFAMRGNVLDMAVGVILGTAFGAIVTSLVNDILMPPIGLVVGSVDFSSLFVNLGQREVASLAEARETGVPTINYGVFLNTVLNFLIVAFAVFLLVRQVNRLRREPESVAEEVRTCPYCLSNIADKATRCAHCTSELSPA